jgi:hypothetical protein
MPHAASLTRTLAGSGALPLAAAICLIALPLSGCRSPGLAIERVNEPKDVATDFPLRVEHWAEPRIALLRRQEDLDRVVEGATGEFDRFLRLMAWTRAQWPIGVPDPYPPCNGVDILAAIRTGRTGGFCGQYSFLLADALKSFGYFSVRYIELESPDGDGHFVVEAWSNQHDRWIVLDPTYNVHYLGPDGLPLGAMELHDAWVANRAGEIRAMEGSPPPRDGRRIGELPHRGIDSYARLAFSTRSDLASLSAPLTIADREKLFVRYDDPRTGPFEHMRFVLATDRASDLTPAVAQVDSRVVKLEGDRALIELSTRGSLPHFMAYEVRLDAGPWRRTGARIEWTVPAGEHRMEFAAVNVAGVRGPVFELRAMRH